MKLLLSTLILSVMLVPAFGNRYASISRNGAPNASTGSSFGPLNIGGRYTGTCTTTDTSYSPPHVYNSSVDTTDMTIWIGVLSPSGARAPCTSLVSWSLQGTWIPPATPPDFGYSAYTDGVGAGVKTVAWTYNNFTYSYNHYIEVYCNGLTLINDSFGSGPYSC